MGPAARRTLDVVSAPARVQDQPAAGEHPPTRLARLGAAGARHPWWFVVTWVVLVAACFAVAVGGVTGESLFPRLHSGAPSSPGESTDAQNILDEHATSGGSLLLQVTGAPLDNQAAVAEATKQTQELTTIEGVKDVQSPLLVPGGVTSAAAAPLLKDNTPTSGGFVTVVQFDPGLSSAQSTTAHDAVTEQFDRIVAALPGATGQVGGVQPLVKAITDQVETDLRAGEGIALPLSFIVMVFVFGGFVAAGMPIAGAIASIAGGLGCLYVFSSFIDLDATVVNVVTLLGLGLSIDYGLLTVSRFREELARIAEHDGEHRRHSFSRVEVVDATARTVATAGRTVMFSGLTVAIAISGLMLFDADIMRAVGAAGVSVVLVAIVVDLTLLPSLCALGAKRLMPRAHAEVLHQSDKGVFSRLARFVQHRPVPIIVGTLAVLIVLSIPAYSMKLTSSGSELLPVSSPQRVFFDDLATDYPALATPAVTVVAHAPVDQVTTWGKDYVATLPGVTRVVPREVGGGYSALSVFVEGGPLGDQTTDVVAALRDVRAGFPTLVTGQLAAQQDFLTGMTERAPYAVAMVVLGTFVLLFLMTGSVVIPAKALVLNVVSLGAALGVLVWVFEDGNLEGLVQFSSVGAIESMIPFLALAFGFGLSMDYEVFLLARIAELYRQGVPNNQAVALGLQRSGRIITSAALLICIVFAGFAAGQLLIIKEIGVALVVAVVIDATLVRMLLVPATMTILGDWNWWAPAPLRRWHALHGLTE